MEHLQAPVGTALLRNPLTRMVVYPPSPSVMRSEEILNFGLRIGHYGQWNTAKFNGAFTAPRHCPVSFEIALQLPLRGEPAPCPDRLVDVFASSEQALNGESRVYLTDKRDRFGWRRIALDWRLSDIDLRTLRYAARRASLEFARRDVGRMQVVEWLREAEWPGAEEVWGGNHHMGTTRMSSDPRPGVVDADCKVHSIDSIYIGGSSVFAACEHANPTDTIVQLMLRLGDHLRRRLSA